MARPSEGINSFQSKTTERHQILNYVQEITTMGPKNLNFGYLTLKNLDQDFFPGLLPYICGCFNQYYI